MAEIKAEAEAKVSSRIHIELFNGRIVEADLIEENDRGYLVKNTKDLKTNKVRVYPQTYYESEIKAVRRLDDQSVIVKATPTASTNGNNNNDRHEDAHTNGISNGNGIANGKQNGAVQPADSLHHSEQSSTTNEQLSIVPREIIKRTLSQNEHETIKGLAKNAVYIVQFDEHYHAAVKDLAQQELVAVSSEYNFGRLGYFRPLLTFATFNKVYLFDMLRLGPMRNELKSIFSSERPKKVLHCSALFVDYLKHKENCSLNNILDTLMVHYSLQKQRQHISIQELFTAYLEPSFTWEEFNYTVRPLSERSKSLTAFQSLLLMKVYWHLNDILLQRFCAASKIFSETYQNVRDQSELMLQMNKRKYPGEEKIDINAIDDLDTAELESLHLN